MLTRGVLPLKHPAARDLALIGAGLANGGVNLLTGDVGVDTETCRYMPALLLRSIGPYLFGSRAAR